MTNARMLIIVPTRSRPQNVAKVVQAWEDTDAFRHADLLFAVDMDDPKRNEYGADIVSLPLTVRVHELTEWKPMVHKLNITAMAFSKPWNYFAVGFAGDDHLPRTHGWAARYLEALVEMGTGIVSCPDGLRDDDLPTQWAMTSDIVRALGRMVPAPVEHLYCDDAIRDLAKAAGCWRWLPDLMIEHQHPLRKQGDVSWDDQYRHVNRSEQYERDSAAYEEWKRGDTPRGGLGWDAETVRGLIAAHTAPNASGGDSHA